MGRRASYAIREQGRIRFAADRWAATEIPAQVAWGPAALLAQVHRRDEATALLDETWCEGAVGMDLDARRLVFFGGETLLDHGGLRDAVLALVRASWPDWDVRWAHDGVVDVADLFGLDRGALEPRPLDATAFAPASANEGTIVTLDARHAALDLDGIEELLAGGPAILDALDACAIRPLAREIDAYAGAVIDRAARQITYWYSQPQRDRSAELAARWPGWRIERSTGGFREHVARAQLDGDACWLTRDEVEPYGPTADVEDERRLAENLAERHAEGHDLVLHPLVESLLATLDQEEARRSQVRTSWLRGFPR